MYPSYFSGRNIGMDSARSLPYASPSLQAKHAAIATVDALALDDFVEPILQENPNRFTLFPINYNYFSGCIQEIHCNYGDKH